MTAVMAVALSGAAQDYDSAYVARVRDSVEMYYRTHPAQRAKRPSRCDFKALPLYGVLYTQETQFTAMGGFVGTYRTSADTLLPLSSVGATAMLSTNLSAAAVVTGTWYSPGGHFMIDYKARFLYSPRSFWGLGYACASDNANRSSFTAMRAGVRADFLYSGVSGMRIGAMAAYDYYSAGNFSSPWLIDGCPLTTHYASVGFIVSYDSRDEMLSPSRGMFVELEQSANIPLSGNGPFYRAEVTADFYAGLWRGCVMAVDLYGNLSTCGSPWTMWPDAGGDVRMRGYYQGRYRDRNLLSVQLELRQHIYGCHGVVAWGGAGNVFPSTRRFDIKNTLPTYGAGYRLSFAGLVFRLDAGFGIRGQWAVIAGFNHSF